MTLIEKPSVYQEWDWQVSPAKIYREIEQATLLWIANFKKWMKTASPTQRNTIAKPFCNVCFYRKKYITGWYQETEHNSQGYLYFETIQKLNKINLTVNSNKKYTVQNTGEIVPKKNISQNSCWILRKYEAAFEVPRLDIISRCSEPQEKPNPSHFL